MKKIISVIGLCLTLISSSSVAFAHTSGPTGSESSQWILDIGNHAGTSSVKYTISSSANSTDATNADDGAYRWTYVGASVTFSKSSSGYKGYLYSYSDPNSSTLAAFTNYASSSGHLTSWNIKMNTPILSCYSPELRKATMAHEFGHAVGLNDLYSSSNSGVLMYGYMSNWTATYPTAADKTGSIEAAK